MTIVCVSIFSVSTMVGASHPLAILVCCLFFYLTLGAGNLLPGQKTWCVARPSTDGTTLQANIDYACSQVDCSVLQRGYACYLPDNHMSHASVAMNLYYQAKGRNPWNCHFKNSGIIVVTDPILFLMLLGKPKF